MNKEEKKVNYSISCDAQTAKLNISFKKGQLEGETNFHHKVIRGVIQKIFKLDKLYRASSSRWIVKYNRPITLKIECEGLIIVDTGDKAFKHLHNKLHFRNDQESKNNFLRKVIYLYRCQKPIKLAIEGFSEKENIEFEDLFIGLSKPNTLEIDKFSDFQIAKLCQGMLESNPRVLAKKYFTLEGWSKDDRETAKKIVSVALRKYGFETLNKCLKLPEKSFNIRNSKLAFLMFGGKKKQHKEIRVYNSYLKKELIIAHNKKENKLVVKNTTGNEEVNIAKNGEISIRKNSPSATLAIFISFCEDPIREIIHFGSIMGKCSFCGKELTDPKSINLGFGKVCGENNGLL